MDPAKLREYVEGYDRRKAAEQERRRRIAGEARAVVPRLAEVCRRHGATRVRLFGSLVRGRHGETPDIDLAIEGVPPDQYFDLWSELSRTAPVEVDLVDMAIAPPALLTMIQAYGEDL